MNTETGQLINFDDLKKLPLEEQVKYTEIKRDLTKLEEFNKQIRMYSPCGCGSGKKFKFCCYKKPVR
jgi:uncharacterized protein YchJ